MPDVTLRNLSKYFGSLAAVKKVSLTVKDGELVTLLGPSGCGKTTTLNMIAGLETPDQGEIYIGETLVSSSKGNLVETNKRNIGMVFQSYGLWPHYTVQENVAFGLKMRKTPEKEIKSKVKSALSMVKLGGMEEKFPSQLSGGQQQRVAFARALVYSPSVLLLDEPLCNLDAKLREEMRFELKELHSKIGISTIYVSHDQSEAMVISDRIVVMENGRIVQEGTAKEIYEDPGNKFVAGFIGLTNFIAGKFIGSDEASNLGHVRLKNGQILQCRIPDNTRQDAPVTLSIRPEHIVFRDKMGESKPNSIPAVIKKKVYLGNFLEYWLDIKTETEIRVQTHSLNTFDEHTEINVYFNPDHIIVMLDQ
jgi:ABC-type Fe3+/spermidine/putrescine transport system ATPase subunit